MLHDEDGDSHLHVTKKIKIKNTLNSSRCNEWLAAPSTTMARYSYRCSKGNAYWVDTLETISKPQLDAERYFEPTQRKTYWMRISHRITIILPGSHRSVNINHSSYFKNNYKFMPNHRSRIRMSVAIPQYPSFECLYSIFVFVHLMQI